MCGENRRQCRRFSGEKGSPPRVRGKPHQIHVQFCGVGITPACAGKTQGDNQGKPGSQDHPRVCGENRPKTRSIWSLRGSPPRVRGKRRHIGIMQSGLRITPACAGKTVSSRYDLLIAEDHPRVCGENLCSTKACCGAIGSPPRVRGKRARDYVQMRYTGITPACAGKTSCHF